MQIIISHMNTDFDALASLLAAQKLYPEARIVLSDKQNPQVRRFLNIYRDTLPVLRDRDVDWSSVRKLIMVDVASLQRIGNFSDQLERDQLEIIVYDHHPASDQDVVADEAHIEPVGATVTLLIEEMRRRSISISDFEATIFGLGIYTDTGNFTYNTTTIRDFAAASYLMESGMNLEMVQRFSEESLAPDQQALLDQLFIHAQTHEVEGLSIVLVAYQQEDFQAGLAMLTQKLLDMKGADAVISVVKMKHHVYIVSRANADRINVQPLLQKLGGGGHQHAGSATVKRANLDETVELVKTHLSLILQPAITAEEMMTAPVKSLTPETSIEEAGRLMYRYGHSGYPIIEEGQLVGMITRRDLDKANHHGLGHAPVKAYMTTNLITIDRQTTLEEIQKIVIDRNIGRLPVLDEGRVVGIVTRTNIIEKIHEQTAGQQEADHGYDLKENIQDEMRKELPSHIYQLLREISALASELETNVYLIGGIVRDILLEKENDDVDLVVEGNGIAFAQALHERYGGELTTHESFGTASWTHPDGLEVDVASSRLEYYDRPASLPDVEDSTLKEDLYRRDFTINAMAIHLHEDRFGELVDPFSGQLDLYEKKIRILHNISFVEDPTRILRAVRFEIRFQFKMDEQTESLAIHSMEKMTELSAKRIIDEVKRMFEEEDIGQSMARLHELHFWDQYVADGPSLEELSNRLDKLSRLDDSYREQTGKKSNWFTYFCLPFVLGQAIEAIDPFALKREERTFVEDLRCLQEKKLQDVDRMGELHRQVRRVTDQALLLWLAIGGLTNEGLLMDYLRARRQLPVYATGKDLQNFGLNPGPIYKDILLELEIATLEGLVTSQEGARQWLAAYIEQIGD